MPVWGHFEGCINAHRIRSRESCAQDRSVPANLKDDGPPVNIAIENGNL